MFVHFHSLFAGSILLVILLAFRLPVVTGCVIVLACLLVDAGQFFQRLKNHRAPWVFAFVSLVQGLGMVVVFIVMSFLFFGS